MGLMNKIGSVATSFFKNVGNKLKKKSNQPALVMDNNHLDEATIEDAVIIEYIIDTNETETLHLEMNEIQLPVTDNSNTANLMPIDASSQDNEISFLDKVKAFTQDIGNGIANKAKDVAIVGVLVGDRIVDVSKQTRDGITKGVVVLTEGTVHQFNNLLSFSSEHSKKLITVLNIIDFEKVTTAFNLIAIKNPKIKGSVTIILLLLKAIKGLNNEDTQEECAITIKKILNEVSLREVIDVVEPFAKFIPFGPYVFLVLRLFVK